MIRAAVVCTDSSALLGEHDVARLGIEVVPIGIVLDGELVQADLEPDRFYARLAAGATVATAQPSPAEFAAAYAAAAARGAPSVISIHLDERVSGTAGSAELAAREAPIPVNIVATETVSFGVGICARAAAEALAAGASPRVATKLARRLGSTMRNVFVAPGAPGGRVSGPAGWTVHAFADGRTQPLATCAGLVEAADLMVEHILASSQPIWAAVGHAASVSEAAADDLATRLASSASVTELERYRVGPAVGAHTGPYSFGAFWLPD
ncbi:MAG TPA: DegV family protein [Gaiellaceae bacterium]|nr:DegV family protein [Gaiellaceae bacterium]